MATGVTFDSLSQRNSEIERKKERKKENYWMNDKNEGKKRDKRINVYKV